MRSLSCLGVPIEVLVKSFEANTVPQGTLVDKARITAYCDKLASIGDTKARAAS